MDHYILSADRQLQEINFLKRTRYRIKLFSLFNKVYLLVISYMLLFGPAAFGNTWIGNISNDWHTPGNWAGGVPDTGDLAAILNSTRTKYSPIITSAAVANTVLIQSGGSLTIAIGGTLAISGSQAWGIDNSGSIENNGTLSINNIRLEGLLMKTESLFTNHGTLNIGNTGDLVGVESITKVALL